MSDFLTPHVWVGALLFVRIGTVLMLAPGWGEASVPTGFRLSAALLATLAMAPGLGEIIPVPEALSGAISLIVSEALTGLFFGAAARLLMSATHIGGQIIGLQSGLGLAQQFDPNSGQSGAMIGVFLSMMAICLVMASGIHRLMLAAAAESYVRFPPGSSLWIGDVAQWGLSSVADAFSFGFRIAAPVLAFSLIFNLALGIMNRLIPQVQVFFVALPSSVLMSLSVMAVGMGGGLWAWLDHLHRYAHLEAPF